MSMFLRKATDDNPWYKYAWSNTSVVYLVFYLLPEDGNNGSTVTEIQSTLRVGEHFTGMQTALDMLGVENTLDGTSFYSDIKID